MIRKMLTVCKNATNKTYTPLNILTEANTKNIHQVIYEIKVQV